MSEASFVDVCGALDVPEGGRRVVDVQGQAVALVRVQGRVYAVDNRCPHRDGELGQGDLDGFHLFCPLHAWVFDVRDGRGFFPRGAEVACFTVREADGRLFVATRGVKPSAAGTWP
ncbi:MAG: Rieske 2Fe-2S domain-containing protein [Myxococcaceae bacterium]|nr:Rieske 2Fe-2S domain-containing protein [Myxococcaceae bacterium]MCA3013246.1 Rieske 2Fe-2S domain-containing protein [Myxococcaceae bacterium]